MDDIQKRINTVDSVNERLSQHVDAPDLDVTWMMQLMANHRADLVKQQTKAKFQQAIDLMLPNITLADRVLRGGEVRGYASKSATHFEVEVAVFNVDALKDLYLSTSSAVSSEYLGFNLTAYTPVTVFIPLPAKWLTLDATHIANELAEYQSNMDQLKAIRQVAESTMRAKQLELASASEAYDRAHSALESVTRAPFN